MASNDYFVIVYMILGYLYACVKNGEDPDLNFYGYQAVEINRRYWVYVVRSLRNEGYVEGVEATGSGKYSAVMVRDIQITPEGIAFLQTSPLMAKAKDALKNGKTFIPGI
jgi:hypothetical protein